MTSPRGPEAGGSAEDVRGQPWVFRLFVAGWTPTAARTESNLQELVQRHLNGDGTIEVVDLSENPERATAENIVAIPTVIRVSPGPRRSVVGDLSDSEQAVVGLELPR